MIANRSITLAASLVALAVVGQTAVAQPEAVEPEPAPENCPCACEWENQMGAGGVCDIFDFLDFQNAWVAGDPCAIDLDTSTGVGVGDIFDFLTFQYQFINKMFGNC